MVMTPKCLLVFLVVLGPAWAGNTWFMHKQSRTSRNCMKGLAASILFQRESTRSIGMDTLELIELIKFHKPSIPYYRIQSDLKKYCGLVIPTSTIGYAVRNRLGYSRKKLTRTAHERFTPENMHYTARYIRLVKNWPRIPILLV
eukprot:Lithocolla_globosa_v1_NODE_7924_length_887_cov_1.572115.p1 type:complete len:144 gc:universal NODE_7924_length_887_cov_1.572115:176-607(+)